MRNTSLEVLEGRIGYHFREKYLLECALTHTSFANEQKIHRYKDYERLEFLGDAVLEMVSSAFLYKEYPEKREGELTKLRASLVCEPSLADCARHLGMPEFLRLGKGEEASGGRDKESILCDVVEAVIGAMYLDCGEIDPPRDWARKDAALRDPRRERPRAYENVQDRRICRRRADRDRRRPFQKSGGAAGCLCRDQEDPGRER